MEAKQNLRKYFKTMRNQLSYTEVEAQSKIIRNKLLKKITKCQPQKILLYEEIHNEVAISALIVALINEGIKVFLPRYIDHRWVVYSLETGQTFNSLSEASFANHDIALVPGLAFTAKGTRLGYGGGVYDRWLSDSKAIKIGICYQFQVVSSLPHESHDIPMDLVLTDVS